MTAINIVFDGPPGAQTGRFVEVEDDDGQSLSVGEWVPYGDSQPGWWKLRISELPYRPVVGDLNVPQPITITICSICKEPWSFHTARAYDEVEVEDQYGDLVIEMRPREPALTECVVLLKFRNQGPPGPPGPTGPPGRAATIDRLA